MKKKTKTPEPISGFVNAYCTICGSVNGENWVSDKVKYSKSYDTHSNLEDCMESMNERITALEERLTGPVQMHMRYQEDK